jgi:ABC-type dipeptide/oligopeptide/nickel transport system permease component
VGHLLVKSIYRRDYPVIQGGVLLIGALFLIVNFIVDLTYCYLNPKIKYDS